MGSDPLIVRVIHEYHPDWDPPNDYGSEWLSCLCPWHGDSRNSASVSFENDAFACYGCGYKGDALAIIMREEGINFKQAIDRAEAITGRQYTGVSQKPAGKPGRRVFGEAGPNGPGGKGGDREVSTRVRRRPRAWT